MKKECKDCLHFEVCAYAAPDLPICDSFLSYVQDNYAKRFIVFTNEELDKIKAGELVVCKDCDFSDHGEPYDIFCISEDWYVQYISLESKFQKELEENLP